MTVTDADRKAAWVYHGLHCLPDSQQRERWFSGYYDNQPEGHAIRAFAAHRLATIEQCAKVAEDTHKVWVLTPSFKGAVQRVTEAIRALTEGGDNE